MRQTVSRNRKRRAANSGTKTGMLSALCAGRRYALVSAAGIAGALLTGPARATPPGVLEAAPSDVVAVYWNSAQQCGERVTAPSASTLALGASIADLAIRLGLLCDLDTRTRMWIDAVAAVPVVAKHPHAAALIDVRAAPRADGGHQLARLKAALIINTRGENEQIERRIQHLLNTYTNTGDTSLVEESKQAQTVFSLRDRRLPAWAVVTWGRAGDYFVIALGEGTFDHISDTITGRSKSLAADPWFTNASTQVGCVADSAGRGSEHQSEQSAAKAPASADSAAAPVGLFVHFERLKRDADASLSAKIERVQAALGLGGAERGLWTGGRRDRALEVRSLLRRGGRDEEYAIADPALLKAFHEPVIPQGASGYAVIDCRPRAVLRGLREAYLSAKSPRSGRQIRSFWRGVEADAGVSVDRDVLSQLGGPIVVHDHPQPALALPLDWTILVPISGDAAALRAGIDRLLTVGRRMLTRSVRNGSPLRLNRDPDGVWYVQYGLVGPALAVTDHWLVVGFSPWAVREETRRFSADH